MSEFLPGELVQITPPFHMIQDQLGVVVGVQSGTGLYRIMLLGEKYNNRILRYSSHLLRKVSDPQEPPRINS